MTDSTFGLELKPWRAGGGWRGVLRWQIDRDPFTGLMALTRVREWLDGIELSLIRECRAAELSWDDIGFALDQTGEAVRKRHSRAVES